MKLRHWLFPPKCVVCKSVLNVDNCEVLADKRIIIPFCDKCKAEFDKITHEKCNICGEDKINCTCLIEGILSSCDILLKLGSYTKGKRDAMSETITALKHRTKSVAEDYIAYLLGRELVRCFYEYEINNPLITFIPRTKAGIKSNGYDHAERIARRVADYCNIEFLECFCRLSSGVEQKTLGYEERKINAEHSIVKGKNMPDLSGRCVVIFDDIVTSGASIGRAGAIAKEYGAEAVVGLCIAVTKYNRVNKKSHQETGLL